MVQMLANGETVEGLVTDRRGEPVGYEAASEEAADEATGEIIERTLIIAADPVLDEDGEIVLRDGELVYEQRNLYLSQILLEAIAELGYTHIRFSVKDEALEAMVSEAEYVEEGEEEEKKTSYQTVLAEGGLFVLVLQ